MRKKIFLSGIRLGLLAIAMLFGAAVTRSYAQVPFAFSASLTNGTFIRSVTVADVNNDGKPDLISVRGNVSILYVWTNSGSGIFVSNASYSVGGFPYQVIAADVNNDGWVDLITANNGGNSLTILTNDQHGNFALAQTLPQAASSQPHSVAAADLFGRGRLDLISANSLTANVTIWTNSGGGIFASNTSLSVGSPGMTVPQWVTTADVNGDGKMDIIAACNNSGTYLFVWTNNGAGGFASESLPFISSGSTCVVAADVNGDGKPDLILDGGITVLTNNGSGRFGINGTYAIGASAFAIAAADVNGDGVVDLISAIQGNNTLVVLTNNGSGIFASNTMVNVGSGPESLAVGDVNGDGRYDLISGNWNAGSLTVVTNVSTFLPRLALKQSGTNVIISWPAVWTAWTLQQNSNLLNQSGWTGFTGNIGTNGATKSATNSTSPGNWFFRLSSQ